MGKMSREELVEHFKECGWLTSDRRKYYNSSTEEKSDKATFEAICKKHNGQQAIILSDDNVCNNKELVLLAKKYGFWGDFHLLSEELLDDPDVALTLAENCNSREFTNFSKRIRSDLKLMRKVVKINPEVYCSLPLSLKLDREIVMTVAKYDAYRLRSLNYLKTKAKDAVFRDKDIAITVAKYYPHLLPELFPSLLSDDDVIEAAFKISKPQSLEERIKQNTWVLPYIDSKYWINNEPLIKQALKEDGQIYEQLPEKLKHMKKYALIAVASCPYILDDLPDQFKDDKEIVSVAFQEDSEQVLEFASPRLRADFDIVLKAVRVDGLNLMYASDELRDTKEIVIAAVNNYGGSLKYASKRLRQDKELKRIAADNL